MRDAPALLAGVMKSRNYGIHESGEQSDGFDLRAQGEAGADIEL